MYAFLDLIDTYLKEKNISFKTLQISSNSFPQSFNEAIVYLLKEKTPNYTDDTIIDTYTLRYDSYGGLRLQAIGTNGNNTLAIYSDHTAFSPEFMGKKITESKIVKIANDIEFEQINIALNNKSFLKRFVKNPNEVLPYEYILQDVACEYIEYIDYLDSEYQKILKK